MRELSLHILDLVQNSLEAGASQVELTINEAVAQDLLTICICDNGRGMDAEMVKQVIDPFVTTRTTRRVGLGLPLIDMSSRQSGGYLKVDSKLGVGTTVTAVYGYSHLDRPPLGDMKQTLITLLIGNPDLALNYNHTVNTNNFGLNSLELAEALGGVSLSHPDVIDWLNDFLQQQFDFIYGGAEHENA